MNKLFKQNDTKSCGLIALSNVFQRDISKENDPNIANNIPKMRVFIRQNLGKELEIDTLFYHHEGVREIPCYINDLNDLGDIYGIPYLIQIKGRTEPNNHIVMALRRSEDWLVFDGLREEPYAIKSISILSEEYHAFYGVYNLYSNETNNIITWNHE